MTRRRGVTLLEMLVVLGVLAVLVALTWPAWRPSSARRAAQTYLAAQHAARLRALTGRAVALRWEGPAEAFVVRDGRAEDGAEGACAAPVLRRHRPEGGVAVTRVLRDGVAWLPDGAGRSCDGGGVYGGRVRFEAGDEAWDVVVASSGRLRLERAR
ncbi:MAG: prepilin-type N-terminal cleavage/methylation domain-containing protein [Trueperaceae bacterium]|nr:prepilin-type N-terminal cleavage/methylation domain-containing protein [Trueperaceae bacterium]